MIYIRNPVVSTGINEAAAGVIRIALSVEPTNEA